MSYTIGSIIFDVPILSASGCWASNKEQISELYDSELGGVICKTCTLFSKEGNPEPSYYVSQYNNNVHFNSKGLPNLGYDYYKGISTTDTDTNNKPIILSIVFENYDKLKILLQDYDKCVNKNVLVEINLSCPNLECEIPGYNIHFIHKLLLALSGYELTRIKFGFKLPPYFERNVIKSLAELFNQADSILAYIVSSNSIPNCLPLVNGEPYLSTVYGGMSGKMNKHIALSNVFSFSRYITKDIAIIGCGGIETLEDINDYLSNGARFVQIASCFYNSEKNNLDIDKINNLIHEFKNNNK
jgi:dihydroorotate dehydrogenase (fumarate)